MAPIEAKEGTPYAFLLKRLIFYQSYHNNFWNKLIHVICVPLIVWGALALLCRLQVNLPGESKSSPAPGLPRCLHCARRKSKRFAR